MEAGKLRHRVDIDSKVETQDKHGSPAVSWLLWAEKVPAAIEPLMIKSKEFVSGNQILSQATSFITIRWREGVVPTMRVRHGETIYNIHAVVADKETGRTSLTLYVSSGTNDG